MESDCRAKVVGYTPTQTAPTSTLPLTTPRAQFSRKLPTTSLPGVGEREIWHLQVSKDLRSYQEA